MKTAWLSLGKPISRDLESGRLLKIVTERSSKISMWKYLIESVSIYHPAALGLNPNRTIDAFKHLYLNCDVGRMKISNKKRQGWPLFKKITTMRTWIKFFSKNLVLKIRQNDLIKSDNTLLFLSAS